MRISDWSSDVCSSDLTFDPRVVKNEGLFHAVDIVLPENTIVHPPINKPAALGSFHPACEIIEAICVALADVVPERSCPQVYKIGMPNAVIGFDARGMWMDQGVDARSMDSSRSEEHTPELKSRMSI